MRSQTFSFRRFPAERAQLLTGGPAWGRRSLLSFVGGIVCLLAAMLASTSEPQTAVVLALAALELGLFSAVALCVWLWRSVRGPHRPWGRLLLVGLLGSSALGAVAQQQHGAALAALLGAFGWAMVIGLVVRFFRRGRGRPAQDQAARWAAGARGETIVADALARLETDHVVINNLPIPGRGDADHIVIGPAGVVVVETKLLAGRITCLGDGTWLQVKRDEVRQIGDPAAQVKRAAAAVERQLAVRGLSGVPVRAVLVLAHPHAELDVERSAVPAVRPFQLVPLLRRMTAEQVCLNGSMVAAVASALLGSRVSVDGREGAGYARV